MKAAKKPAKKAAKKSAKAAKKAAKKPAKKAAKKPAKAAKAAKKPAKKAAKKATKKVAKNPAKRAATKATKKVAKKSSGKVAGKTPSEDELRTKIVYQFLLDLNFSPNDVKIECPFSVQLGRGKFTLPRTDILVSKNGNAWFIIECKREDHELTDDDQKQAISYARLVQPQTPPYAFLTNGKQTVTLDTYTGKVAKEVVIKDGVVVAPPLSFEEAMRRRYEANKYLLSLSSDMLTAFIAGELDEQIKMHSTGVFRPPYSPAVHIPRTNVCDAILEFCASDSDRILPIVGPATIGKSSEIFSCIQRRLLDAKSSVLPLYIPLNYAGTDFLPYLAANFGWALGRSISEIPLIHDIDEIARLQRRTCIVYILDGADLAPADLSVLRKQVANLLHRSKVLSCRHKVIVVSQEPTWSQLVMGQGVDLSPQCGKTVLVERLSEEQSIQHIQALEAHYAILMPQSNGLPGLPVISHMLAQQTKAVRGGPTSGLEILVQYFDGLLKRVTNSSALLRTLINFSEHQLEEVAPFDLGKHLDLDDAVTAGFLIRSKDMLGRESYTFYDDWINYFIVGFHLWKLDCSPPEKLAGLVEQAGERVESARALEWLSYIMGEHASWRAVAERRPSHYLRCYKHATSLLKVLSVGDEACLWLAPSKGSLNDPWISIIVGEPGEIRWGKDPDDFPDDAPSEHTLRHEFSIFSRKPLALHMADDAITALKEIRRWLPDRGSYRDRNRLWLAQHTVFARLRHRLSGRLYNLADVARTIETPTFQAGVQMLREIFEDALSLTRSVADAEFFGIRDLMPEGVRYEIEVYSGQEITAEYFMKPSSPGVDLTLAQRGEIEHWWKRDDLFTHEQVMGFCASDSLLRILGVSPISRNWVDLNRLGALREVNAVGNIAARWLADGLSSAVLERPSREMSDAKFRILAHLKVAGIVEYPEEELQVTESVLRSFRESSRISTWIRTENGFIIDGFWTMGPIRKGAHGIWITVVPERARSVKIIINPPYEPASDADAIEHTLVVGRADLKDALVGMLNRFVGFPHAPDRTES